MKKLLCLIGCSLALAASAQVTNSTATYTNGITVRVPLSDQQYDALAYIKQSLQLTNMTASQVVTNYTRLVLTDEAMDILNSRQLRLADRLRRASEAKIEQVEAILSAP